MEPFSKREDREPSLLERSLRTVAGIGVGFGSFWAFKSGYRDMRRKFLGLSDPVKRHLERHLGFTRFDEQVTDFEVRTGLKSYISEIAPDARQDVEIDAFMRKDRQISEAMGRVKEKISMITQNAEKAGVEGGSIMEFVDTFEKFQDSYFKQAIGHSSVPIYGSGEADKVATLRTMLVGDVMEASDKLTLVRDRLNHIDARVREFNSTIRGIINSSGHKTLVADKRGDLMAAAEAVKEMKTSATQALETARTGLSSLTDLSPVKSPVSVLTGGKTRIWGIGQGAKLGEKQKAFKGLYKTVREAYRDSLTSFADPSMEVAKTNNVVQHIKTVINRLEQETTRKDGAIIRSYKKIDVAVSSGPQKEIVIRALGNDGKDRLMRLNVHRTWGGAQYVQRDGKEFTMPFQAQRDYLREQAEILSRGGNLDTVNERLEALGNELQWSKTTLADVVASQNLYKGTGEKHKIYESGFTSFKKIARGKLGKAGTLHLDIKVGSDGIPTQIGWILKDGTGKSVDGYQFNMGIGGTPANLIDQQMGGHKIIQNIGKGNGKEVVEALSRSLHHPKLWGNSINVVTAGLGDRELKALKALIDANSSEGASVIKMHLQGAIDITNLPIVTGKQSTIGGREMFLLLREYTQDNPRLKKVIEEKLLRLGIPGLSDIGLKVFSQGITPSFHKVLMESMFPEAIYLAMRKATKTVGTEAFSKALDAEIEEVTKHGMIPERLLPIDVTKGATAYEQYRVVSPQSHLGGTINVSSTNVAGWFPSLRRGRGDRLVHSQQLRKMTPTMQRRIQKELKAMGGYKDLPLAVRNTLNNINTMGLLFADAGETAFLRKDDVLVSSRLRRRTNVSSVEEIVEKNTLQVKVGDTLGAGAGGKSYIGKNGPEVVTFEKDKGIVKDIIDIGNGQVKVCYDVHWKIGIGTQMLMPHSATVTPGTLEERIPGLPKAIGLATAFDLEKTAPGVIMTGMLNQAFWHAGGDSGRQALLRSILVRKLEGKTGLGAPFLQKLFTKKMGMLTVRDGNINLWRDIWEKLDVGDLIEVMEGYNLQVGGSFTANQMLLNAGRGKRASPFKVTKGTMALYGRILESNGAVEANVRIARENLRRETNPDVVKGTTDSDAEQLIRELRQSIPTGGAKRTISADNLLGLWIKSRPDVARALEREGLPLTAENFFSKIGALNFNVDINGQTHGVLLDVGPYAQKDPDILSGAGQRKVGEVGPDFLDLIADMPNNQKTINAMAKELYKQKNLNFGKMFGLPIATGKIQVPHLEMIGMDKARKILDNFINTPEAASGALAGFVPEEAVYEYNGGFMTTKQAREHGILMKFRNAIDDGSAKKVTDFNFLRKHVMTKNDVDPFLKLQSFVLAFGQNKNVHVRVPGRADADVSRLLVTSASLEDAVRVSLVNKRTKESKLGYLISPQAVALQKLMKETNSGAFTAEADTLVNQYLVTQGGKPLVKEALRLRLGKVDVPIVKLGGYRVSEIDLSTVTTKAGAESILHDILGVREVSRKGFLSCKALTRTTNIMAAGTEAAWNEVMSGISWDSVKWTAKRMVGNIQAGERKMTPKTFMLHLGAGKIPGTEWRTDKETLSAYGVLERALAEKQENAVVMRLYKKYLSRGFYEAPLPGVKWPAQSQNKLLAGGTSRTSVDGSMPWGSNTGQIGIQPGREGELNSYIDRDGDIVELLMSEKLKLVDLMEDKAFLPVYDDEMQLSETKGGMAIFYDPKTSSFRKEPLALSYGEGFDKLKTIHSEVLTKKYAGITDTISKNTLAYMQRMLSGKGGKLALDLGQFDPVKMVYQTREAMAAFGELALKGKSTSSATDSIERAVRSMGDSQHFNQFAKDMIERAKDPAASETRKLIRKIEGTEYLWPGSNGLNALEILRETAMSGSSVDDVFGGIVPEHRMKGMKLAASGVYGMRGAMVQAMNSYFFTQGIPTMYNEVAQEGIFKSMKRNIQNDLGEKSWRRVSTGMGWLAGAGAIALAANFFNRDGMGWLGHRPGTGTEQFDWSFTKPEYQMANLLDVPYANPYDKKRAYVAMDNPLLQNKFAALNKSEARDLQLIHQAVQSSRMRDTISGPGNRRYNVSGTLERYGHV